MRGIRSGRSWPARASAGCAGCRRSRAWPPLLHLVQHLRELLLETQRLLDLVGSHIRILPVFQEAGPLMIPEELDERGGVGLPVLGESLEVLEHGVHAESVEQGDGVFSVLVEVGVED